MAFRRVRQLQDTTDIGKFKEIQKVMMEEMVNFSISTEAIFNNRDESNQVQSHIIIIFQRSRT
jgi:hypothetical protein